MTEPTLCEFCQERPGSVRAELPLPLPVCDVCLKNAEPSPEPTPLTAQDQIAVFDHRDAPAVPAKGPVCRECNGPIQWYRTLRGKSLPMEVDPYPASHVPWESSWEVTHGDTVARVRANSESGHVRVCHFDVCPARVPEHGPEAPHLRAAWKRLRGY